MLATTKGKRLKATTPKVKRSKVTTPAEALADISLKDDRLVPTTEAAVLVGRSAKCLREWRCQRIGPAALKMGSGRQARVFYRLSSLEAWVRANVTSVTGGDA